jgi:hypothetical protein
VSVAAFYDSFAPDLPGDHIGRAAEAAGYDAVAWMAPEEADFHQPLMTARASS